MRLLVISDVHLEFGPFQLSEPMPDFDVAVFAGDIHKPIAAAISWMAEQREAGPLGGREIVYVAGNHEFYNSEMKGNLAAGAEQADAAGIYRKQIDPIVSRTNNEAYREAVELLRRIKKLMARLGQNAEFTQFLAALRETHRRKRNFMAMAKGL